MPDEIMAPHSDPEARNLEAAELPDGHPDKIFVNEPDEEVSQDEQHD